MGTIVSALRPASGLPSLRAMRCSRSRSRRRWTGRCCSTRSSAATSASDGDAGTCARRRRASATRVCDPDLNLKFASTTARSCASVSPAAWSCSDRRHPRPPPAQERRGRIDGIEAYALFTQQCVDVMDVDVAALGMRAASESYEHIGVVPCGSTTSAGGGRRRSRARASSSMSGRRSTRSTLQPRPRRRSPGSS